MGDRCRSCRAPILWAALESGRRMPVNADPSDDGTVSVDLDRHTPSGAHPATVLGPLEIEIVRGDGEPLYLSHFATCPQADKWRTG